MSKHLKARKWIIAGVVINLAQSTLKVIDSFVLTPCKDRPTLLFHYCCRPWKGQNSTCVWVRTSAAVDDHGAIQKMPWTLLAFTTCSSAHTPWGCCISWKHLECQLGLSPKPWFLKKSPSPVTCSASFFPAFSKLPQADLACTSK